MRKVPLVQAVDNVVARGSIQASPGAGHGRRPSGNADLLVTESLDTGGRGDIASGADAGSCVERGGGSPGVLLRGWCLGTGLRDERWAHASAPRGDGTLAANSAVRRLVGEVEPDLVHTTLYEADIAGRVGARLAGVPVVSSLVNSMYGPVQAQNQLSGAHDCLRREQRCSDCTTGDALPRDLSLGGG